MLRFGSKTFVEHRPLDATGLYRKHYKMWVTGGARSGKRRVKKKGVGGSKGYLIIINILNEAMVANKYGRAKYAYLDFAKTKTCVRGIGKVTLTSAKGVWS